MSPSSVTYELPSAPPGSSVKEEQIELKTLGVNPRRAMEQIVDYKNDLGNGYTKTLLCFLQLFIVSNRDQTFYFANKQELMIMRPYQVYAVQQMVKCIDDDGNGFVWHTTGSGKTLTSFKASTLLKENDSIHKCVFVVDRKDLDRQTREYWSSSDKTSSEGDVRRGEGAVRRRLNQHVRLDPRFELMIDRPHGEVAF